MIRWLLLVCAFLICGAALYQLLLQDSGYILIVWGKTSIEMSLWFALVLLFLVLFLLWLFLSTFYGGLKGFSAVKRKVFNFSEEKAQSITVDGLIDFIEGNWPSARKKLLRSASKVKAPVINYLTAARCAYEMDEEQAALELLYKAERSTDKGGLAIAITQAKMQFFSQQYEQALATLERATTIDSAHPVVLNLRQQVYVALKDWDALKSLLPQLTKKNLCSPEERHQLELTMCREKLEAVINKNAADKNKDFTDRENSILLLKQAWSTVPDYLQADTDLLCLYSHHLMALGQDDEVEKILSKVLKQEWHNHLLDLYGLLVCTDAKKPLQVAEKWLINQPQNASLLLAIGRLCLQNQQWGRAMDFFEKSIALQPRPETYAELARALDYIGETEKSIHYYKQGLILSSHTLTDEKVFKSKSTSLDC